MRALALLALCLPAIALAGTPLDKYEGSIGEVQIDGMVELPLYGGVYGDEIPYVLVNFGEEDEGAWLFRVKLGAPDVKVAAVIGEDFGDGVKTMNKRFFASLGKKKDEAVYKLGGKKQMTHIDEIHLAEGLVLYDVDAEVESFDSAPLLTDSPPVPTVFGDLSLYALGLPVAILPSEGVVRIAPADQGQQLLDAVGGTVLPYEFVEMEIVKTWAGKEAHANYDVVVQGEINGQPVLVNLVTHKLSSRIGDEVDLGDGPVVPISDWDGYWTSASFGDLELGPSWIGHRDVARSDHPAGVHGYLGYSFLSGFDIAIDPASGQIALNEAKAQQRAYPLDAFIDAAAKEIEALDAPPEDGEVVEKTEEDLEAEKEKRAGMLSDKAFLHLVGGDVDQGIALLEEATGLDADPCEWWLNLSQAYAAGHRFDDAAIAAQKGMDRFLAWNSLDSDRREEIEKMDDEEREASAVQPQDLDACHAAPGMVAYYQLVSGDLDQVVATYGEHVDLHPAIGVVAGIAHLLAGDDDAAQGPLRQTLNMGARSGIGEQGYLNAARIALAELYRRGGDLDTAIDHWDRNQSWLVGDPFAVQQYADLVAAQSDAAGALAAVQALSATHADSPVVLAVLGGLYTDAGQEAEAAEAYDQAGALLDHLVTLRPQIGELHAMKAWSLVLQGEMAGAQSAAVKAIELAPGSGYAHWALMNVAADAGLMPKAMKHYELAKSYHMGHYFFATLEEPEPPPPEMAPECPEGEECPEEPPAE